MPALPNARHERFYVYAVRVDGRTRYIGKGCGNRSRVHMTRSHNELLAAEVEAARATGRPVRVRIIKSGMSARDALRLERRMIFKWSHRLTNVSMGNLTETERLAMACRANLQILKTEDVVRREGDWNGVDVEKRVSTLRRIREDLLRYAEMAEAA